MSDEAPPRNFLGLPDQHSDPSKAAVRILPVPYEATVSYLGGTKNGPQAIIDASRAVELYDIELDDEPYDVGVATLPELALTGAGPAQAMRQLRKAYAKAAAPGRFVIMLGGEHSISWRTLISGMARSPLTFAALTAFGRSIRPRAAPPVPTLRK